MKLFIPLFFFSFLNAKGIDDDSLNGIYTEAIVFLSVFGFMSIISIIISKKNAKKFEADNPLETRRTTRREEELQKELDCNPMHTSDAKVDRLLELSNMLEKGLISQQEFDMLKNNLNIMK